MSKRGLIFSILIIISLSLISSVVEPVSQSTSAEKIQEGIQEASYHAAQYHSGNEAYTEYLTKMSQVQEEINAALVSSSQDEIKKAVGNPNQEVQWVSQSQGSDVKLEKAVPAWDNKIIFDGKEQVKYNLQPQTVDNSKVQYKIDFTTEFSQSRPNLKINEEIANLEEKTKTFIADPSIININDLAERTVNIEKLFSDYVKQTPSESCEGLMSTILGEENKLSKLEIVTKDYEVVSNGKVKVFATLETCENCKGQGVENFVNLKMRMEKDGIAVQYTDNKFTPDMFEKLNVNGQKAGLIEANKALNELMDAGNYKAAEDMMYRMQTITQAWNNIASMGDEKAKTESFVERNNFMNSLFQDLPSKTSISEQTLFQKTIYKELKNDTIPEICNNQIDDNQNSRIDCQELSCSGQVCGTKGVTYEENNQTLNKTINLYCIEGSCQAKEEKQNTTEPKCGNNICEAGETETCASDCTKCPEFQPITCQGEVIFKGKDENGCSIDPVCIQKTNSCSTTSDCDQPLCGTSECVSGECKTTSIGDCKEKTCSEGDQKSQKCQSGGQITVEICTNGVWKSTGFKCSGAISGSVEQQTTQPTINHQACTLSTDCGKQGEVCTNGLCQTLALKQENPSGVGATSVNGISFTGQAVSITSTGTSITGITREINNPDILKQPTDFQTPNIADGQSKSFITGVSRGSGGEDLAVDVNVQQTDTTPQKPIESSGNEKELFVVTGLCVKDKEGEKSLLSFDGQGDKFAAVSNLKTRYEKEGTEPYCKWRLENLLRERKEIEKSFTYEFAKNFFEEQIPNSADNWESASKPILKIHEQNVENQKETAEMMECLGLKELTSYNLININYDNPQYGSLIYEEKTETVKLPGMTNEVKIITPTLKEFLVFPSKTFIENDLSNSMKNHAFPGSIETQAERELNSGLTNSDIEKIKNDKVLMQKFADISSQETDQNLDIQLKFVDENGKTVYNAYLRVNGKDGIRAQPLLEDETPSKDMVVEVGFNEIYDILSQSEKRLNQQDAPWQKESFAPITLAQKTIDYFDTRTKVNNLLNSVKVQPPQKEKEIKSIFEDLFYKFAEKAPQPVVSTNIENTQKVWTSSGTSTTLLN